MENVVLVIHLILAFALICVVLLQRSEGSALLSGGGNMAGRSATTGLAKLTWALAAAFISTSIALTVIAASNSAGVSVVDRLGVSPEPAPDAPALPPAGDLLPPTTSNAPAAPQPVD